MKTIKLFAAFALAFQLVNAQQPGDLDPTFGTNGLAQTEIAPNQTWEADLVRNVVALSNGKTLAVGFSRLGEERRAAYVCYNADGTLDTSFGNNGILLATPSNEYYNFGTDAVELPDGTIFSCGYVFNPVSKETWPFLLKIKNGKLDTSFGSNGFVISNVGECVPERMALQADGKVVLGGYLDDNIAAIRYNTDGLLDNTFGENGLSVTVIEGSEHYSFAKDLALQADGKVVLATYFSDGFVWKWAIVRLNADGKLDDSFGEGGISKIVNIGYGHDFVQDIGIMSDGKIIVSGHSWDANVPTLRYSMAVARFNTDGTMDNTFGTNGVFRKNFTSEGCSYATGLAISPNDNIYVAFSPQESTTYDIGLFSLDRNGKLNPAFGDGGVTTLDINGHEDHSGAVQLQADGKLIMGVISYTDSGTPFGVARFITDVTTNNNMTVLSEKSFVAYPNPVKDVLNIECDGNFSVHIFDMSGRMVLTDENSRTIDVKALAAGNYIIKLTSGEEAYTDRFVKL